MGVIFALKIHDTDNVATVFSQDARAGRTASVQDRQGNVTKVQIREDIPYGHKIAVRPVSAGSPIIKYGEIIGAASCDIAAGAYVHVHDMDSLRGRGDLARTGEEV